ncbi:MAG TPA: serine/threonine protein kinase, partial [Streptomyces sp.]
GPATPLAAERARQARIAVVGPVTERWAPEQAGPVHENWQLAPPIGPATDLWALGALLYRAVQGHAPYPEDNAAELVQLVCAEPPAFAEECGPLRPVVESLLRQDPTERPDFEELRGWLRSLVRSAPEPEAGAAVVPLPAEDPSRLPIVRRRGELVRRRRGRGAAAQGGRHRHKKGKEPRRPQAEFQADQQHEFHEELPQYAPKPPKAPKAPRSPHAPRAPRALGRLLLLLILLLLAAAVAYAMLFLPKNGAENGTEDGGGDATPQQSQQPQEPQQSTPPQSPRPTSTPKKTPAAPSAPAPDLAPGYALHKDPEGFQVAVPKGWKRAGKNSAGQVRFTSGDFTLLVVPGRDTVQANGSDPMAYQRTKERELQPWRDSSWSGATGLRRIDVGQQAMAEGQFTWQDGDDRELYVRNLALIVGGRYHVVQVIGPDGQRDKVSEVYQQAVKAYRSTR